MPCDEMLRCESHGAAFDDEPTRGLCRPISGGNDEDVVRTRVMAARLAWQLPWQYRSTCGTSNAHRHVELRGNGASNLSDGTKANEGARALVSSTKQRCCPSREQSHPRSPGCKKWKTRFIINKLNMWYHIESTDSYDGWLWYIELLNQYT